MQHSEPRVRSYDGNNLGGQTEDSRFTRPCEGEKSQSFDIRRISRALSPELNHDCPHSSICAPSEWDGDRIYCYGWHGSGGLHLCS